MQVEEHQKPFLAPNHASLAEGEIVVRFDIAKKQKEIEI